MMFPSPLLLRGAKGLDGIVCADAEAQSISALKLCIGEARRIVVMIRLLKNYKLLPLRVLSAVAQKGRRQLPDSKRLGPETPSIQTTSLTTGSEMVWNINHSSDSWPAFQRDHVFFA